MRFNLFSTCKCTIYIIEEPARLPRDSTGRHSRRAREWIPPPAPKTPPLFSSLLFFSSGSRSMYAGWIPPHPNAGRGLAVVYSPIRLVGDACGCRRLEWAGRIARLIAGGVRADCYVVFYLLLSLLFLQPVKSEKHKNTLIALLTYCVVCAIL